MLLPISLYIDVIHCIFKRLNSHTVATFRVFIFFHVHYIGLSVLILHFKMTSCVGCGTRYMTNEDH